jgi:hypothetical protein
MLVCAVHKERKGSTTYGTLGVCYGIVFMFVHESILIFLHII